MRTLLEPRSYWLYSGGKKIQNDVRISHYDTLEVMPKMVGGSIFDDIFDDMKDAILDAIGAIFNPVKEPIQGIIKFFVLLAKFLMVIVKATVWTFMLIAWFYE